MKRLIALLCMVACIMSLVGCGGGASSNTVLKINGKEYDLTKDHNKTISALVKDEIVVMDANGMGIFDESGYAFLNKKPTDLSDDEKSSIMYTSIKTGAMEPYSVYYLISSKHNNALEFETAQGIKDGFDADDLKKLEGFVPSIVNYTQRASWREENDEYSCAALYVDGKIIDLSKYEDEAEEMLEDVGAHLVRFWVEESEEHLMIGIPQFFTTKFIQYGLRSSVSDKDSVEYEANKGTLMLLLAQRDYFRKVADGKYDYLCLISYTCVEGESAVAYEFYGTKCTDPREWKNHVE